MPKSYTQYFWSTIRNTEIWSMPWQAYILRIRKCIKFIAKEQFYQQCQQQTQNIFLFKGLVFSIKNQNNCKHLAKIYFLKFTIKIIRILTKNNLYNNNWRLTKKLNRSYLCCKRFRNTFKPYQHTVYRMKDGFLT